MDWQKYVRDEDRYLQPSEVDLLIGDASKAQNRHEWKAQTLVPELVKIMYDAKLAAQTAES